MVSWHSPGVEPDHHDHESGVESRRHRANTGQNFPQTLSVSNVILGGYTDSFNLLLLNNAVSWCLSQPAA